jgi:ribulose-phosphate 3-epimerase
MAKIAPSILSADFANMGEDIAKLETWGASLVHCDVMDGVFVPNMSFGPQMISAIKKYTTLPLDVHLMITQPERYVETFAKAGADIITIHQEATMHLQRTLKLIADCGMKVGVALNPATSLVTLEYILNDIDMVLIMTVNPGYGGQKLIPETLVKIKALKHMIAQSGKHIEIEVDGGVNAGNADQIIQAGADILVAGSAVFDTIDPKKAICAISERNMV